MTSINEERGVYIRITREMERKFSDAPEVLRWMRAVAYKLSGSGETLADVEQKSTVPFMSMVQQLDRRVTDAERTARSAKLRIYELEREIEDLKRSV